VRRSFVGVLHSAGFDVIEAADGFIALETLKETSAAAVVLDVRMPVLDGFGVLDKLDDPPPVIMVTAHPYDDDVVKRRDKIYGFVQKPVPPQALITLVGDVMRISR